MTIGKTHSTLQHIYFQRYKRSRALIAHSLTFQDPVKHDGLFDEFGIEYMANRKRRDLEQRSEFSMPAYDNDEWNNFAVDNWMLNDNWLLNKLSEVRILPFTKIERCFYRINRFQRPNGGENLEFNPSINYPGKAPLYSFPDKYLNHHHDERSIPGNIYVSEADVFIP